MLHRYLWCICFHQLYINVRALLPTSLADQLWMGQLDCLGIRIAPKSGGIYLHIHMCAWPGVYIYVYIIIVHKTIPKKYNLYNCFRNMRHFPNNNIQYSMKNMNKCILPTSHKHYHYQQALTMRENSTYAPSQTHQST